MQDILIPVTSLFIITFSLALPIYFLSSINEEEKKKMQKIKNIATALLIDGWFLVVDSSKDYDNEYVNKLTRNNQVIPSSLILNLLDKQNSIDKEKIDKWVMEKNKITPYWFHLPSGLCVRMREEEINQRELFLTTALTLKETLKTFEKYGCQYVNDSLPHSIEEEEEALIKISKNESSDDNIPEEEEEEDYLGDEERDFNKE